MSSFAKGNPFSLFFGDPFFLDPLFSFFLFFLSPAKVGSLEMQPGAKLQAYLGVIILQPHACTQRFRLRILRRTRSNAGRTSARSLSGRIQAIWKNPSKERDMAVLSRFWRKNHRQSFLTTLTGLKAKSWRSLVLMSPCPGNSPPTAGPGVA